MLWLKKIDEISEEKSSPLHCAILGILLTIIIGLLVFYLKPFNIMEYLNNKEKIMEVILFLPIMFFIVFIHELIHIGLFILFGKGEAQIKISRNKKYGAIVVKQLNENVFYNKKEIILILLSPLVLLSIILFILMFVIDMPFLIYFNLLLNVLGSSIDFYISIYLLVKHNKNIKVNFDSQKTAMYIYAA